MWLYTRTVDAYKPELSFAHENLDVYLPCPMTVCYYNQCVLLVYKHGHI